MDFDDKKAAKMLLLAALIVLMYLIAYKQQMNKEKNLYDTYEISKGK